MAKARALARAERERVAAEQAARRAAQAARLARRSARRDRLTGWLPTVRVRRRGALATRRRRQVEVMVAVLVVANVLVWFVTPSGSARALAAVASVLVAPVLHTVLFRRD
jgi:hypothetical protein